MTHLARNAMDKFEVDYKEESFTNVSAVSELYDIFKRINEDDGSKIIFNSLDNPTHNKALRNFCTDKDLLTMDFNSYSLASIGEYLGIDLDDIDLDEDVKIVHHYKRLDALDFAIKYDDGQDFTGLKYCDICIIGVSRSSKTPLSVYLASIGYKVSNIPLLIDAKVPRELFEIDHRKIFGLTIDKHRLQKIRNERLNSINLSTDSNYSDLGRIEKELAHAREIMEDLDCKVVDVTYKSIEEISDYIISNLDNN